MAYDTRYLNDPKKTGYLVVQYNSCGKGNCRCAKDGKGHKANYVYYREYTKDVTAGTRTGWVSKLKKKYIPKKDVKKWNRILALNKYGVVIQRMTLDEVNNEKLFEELEGEELHIALYEKYRVRRDKSHNSGVKEPKKDEQENDTKNRYQRFKHEMKLAKIMVKTVKRLENPYDSKARSSAAIKGRIRRRQRHYANKQFSY